MKYIFLVAGRGSRLHPLTLNHPKSMFKLDENTTLIQRMVKLIRKHDQEADIVVVTGHMHTSIENALALMHNTSSISAYSAAVTSFTASATVE